MEVTAMILRRASSVRRLVVSSLAAVLAALVVETGTLVAAEPKACSAPEYRQFDFWAGDWDVYEAADRSKPVARVRVDSILDGCVLREVYEGTNGLVGQSFSIYDGSRRLWHQTWVTNRGQLVSLEGRFEEGRMTLQGAVHGPSPRSGGTDEIWRGIWIPEGGGVRETAQASTDGGATWKPLFDLFFRRRP
jgi:hypothetical protein